jgi:hypothetical protein
MRPVIPLAAAAAAALALLVPEGGGASATTRLDASPRHGHRFTTYTVSFRAEYAVSKATRTQYVIGAVNSGTCSRGVSSFGRVQTGPYRVGQTVRFVLRAPRSGWCVGVFHGVGHFERKVGDRWTDTRIGRFAFRVL